MGQGSLYPLTNKKTRREDLTMTMGRCNNRLGSARLGSARLGSAGA